MTTRRKWAALLLGLVVLTACDKKSSGDKSASANAASESAAPPFTGTLTTERLLSAKGAVKVFDDWSTALTKLEALVGKPTTVKGNTHVWVVVDGDDCTYMTAEKDDRSKYQKGASGDMLGTYQDPMKVNKNGPSMNYDECMELAGKGSAPEDPNAKGPPADGSPVSLQDFLDNAVKGRSKWDKKRVKLSAALQSVSESTWSSGSSSGTNVSLQLVVSADNTKSAVSCMLRTDQTKPASPKAYARVVVEGTVGIRKWLSMGGGPAQLQADLSDCVIVSMEDAAPGPATSASATPSAAPR
ncbi:MAG: hypothetical protein U0271_24075 [Polyangiaceae bacterium]